MNIFIAATRQNDGKTAVSLGLLKVLGSVFENIGYMKPVGQQFRVIDNQQIDKDAVLMAHTFGFKDRLQDISPIAVPPGFTEDFILTGEPSNLPQVLQKAYDKLASQHDAILIEGTGHAGVGSIVNLSNAQVAAQLKAKVIIVSSGGIGRPIDEIMLNYPTFKQEGVEVIGVIINKVKKDKYSKISKIVKEGLKQKGIDILGMIPFEETLSYPTVQEILEDVGGDLVSGEENLTNIVEHFVIGDMAAYESTIDPSEGTLLIVPGNREDLIFAGLGDWAHGAGPKIRISGIIATYGKRPSRKVIDVIQKMKIPLILNKTDSFKTAVQIDRCIFKLRSSNTQKIQKTEELIKTYVDVDRIIEMMKKG